MRKILLVPLMLVSLALAGCSGGQGVFGNIGSAISAATSTIQNPVGSVDIYRAKNAYAATLELAVAYRTYCWSKPYAVLMADPIAAPACRNRRAVVRQIQSARPKVAAAIRTAENFVRNNPTINAGSAITAMWAAVNDFQNLVPRT